MRSAGDVIFEDENYTASGYDTPLNLSDSSAEWDAFETAFGEVSILAAIVAAQSSAASFSKTQVRVNTTATAGTDVGGSGGGANLDAQIHDISGGTFSADHDVYLNGDLLYSDDSTTGANDHDVYPGTSLALGQLKFEFVVKTNDQITVISRA